METAPKTDLPRAEPRNDVKAETGAAPAAAPTLAPVPAPTSTPRKRKPFLILGGIAAAVLIGVVGYRTLTAGRESTDDAQIAADTVAVSARVSGLVAKVTVHDNQPVKRGDLLIELDAADFLARVQQAEAELGTTRAQAAAADAQVSIVEATSRGGLASARAALTGTAAGVGSADAQLASARAAATRADADVHKAEIDLGRAETLRKADAVPQAQLDSAQIALDVARAAKAQAEAQIALAADSRRGAASRVVEARGRVDQSAPVAPQIAAARAGAALAAARVRSSEAALALAKLQLGYTRIVAPTDGYASKLTARDGQLVGAGQPLVELVPTTTYVVANFKETQIGQMHAGQPATIEVDAFPGRKLTGRVESLSGGTGASFSLLPPDNATGNFVKVVQRVPVRIAWVDPPPGLVMRPGLSADVTVDVR